MLKHFIITIYTVVIMIHMVACAEPYDNGISEEPVEIIEDIEEIIEEPVEIVEDINEDNLIEYAADHMEIAENIIEDPYEDASNESIDANDVSEGQSPSSIKLDVILDIFIHQYLDAYLTNIHIKDITYLPFHVREPYADINLSDLPNFCKLVPGHVVMINHSPYFEPSEVALYCTLPHEIQEELDNSTFNDLCYDGECKSHAIEFIATVALMQKLHLLPSDCNMDDTDATVYCGFANDHVFCRPTLVSLTTAQPKSIDDLKLSCHYKDTYDPAVDESIIYAAYNGIWIRESDLNAD